MKENWYLEEAGKGMYNIAVCIYFIFVYVIALPFWLIQQLVFRSGVFGGHK